MDGLSEEALAHLLVVHGRIWAFLWGAVWGSFVNVVVHRLPRGESLVRPASRCAACGQAIRWYDNVPIGAWLWLRGRCRRCGARFSFRYAAIELLAALLSVALYEVEVVRGLSALEAQPPVTLLATYLVRFALAGTLLAVTFIDIDVQLVPTAVTWPGAALGVLLSLLLPAPGPWQSLAGAVLGGGTLVVVNAAYRRVRGRDGFGGGDISLLSMIGAFLGAGALLFVVLAASFQGTLAAAALGVIRRVTGVTVGLKSAADVDDPPAGEWRPMDAASADTPVHAAAIAFVPFLALGAVEWMLVGEAVVSWYFGLLVGRGGGAG